MYRVETELHCPVDQITRYWNMSVQELSKEILSRIPTLPIQLALGARFIVDHPDAVVVYSMREIAKKVGMAPASLLRLARALGYPDWSTMREAYVQRVQSTPLYSEKADSLVKKKGVPGIVQTVIRAQANTLQHAASEKMAEAIQEASKILNRASRLFIAGFLSCRAPGLAFAYICRLFRSNVHLLGAEGTSLVADLADIRSADAILAITFFPYAREIRSVAGAVDRSRASLVCITDSLATPISQRAKATLIVSAETPSFFPSLTPALAMAEALAAAMLAQGGDSAVARLRSMEGVLYDSGSYDATTAKPRASRRRPI
jgi:DNA-binding MurR/RpiR family transcriptional regulator